MKPYSIDFREKIVRAYEQGNTSIRLVAARFDVSKALVENCSNRRLGKVMLSQENRVEG
ncbi:MAG: hypothetical protein V7K89_03570 [Nostoc sp.]